MGMGYQLDRAWVNAAKGIRQLQKADKAMQKDHMDSADDHFNKALHFFAIGVEHLEKAEDDADIKAGKYMSEGDDQLRKAVRLYAEGDVDAAEMHYEKALDKYDEALDLIN